MSAAMINNNKPTSGTTGIKNHENNTNGTTLYKGGVNNPTRISTQKGLHTTAISPIKPITD